MPCSFSPARRGENHGHESQASNFGISSCRIARSHRDCRLIARLRARIGQSRAAIAGARRAAKMTDDEIEALAKGIVPFVREVIVEALEPLRQAQSKLAARVLNLENRAETAGYRGIWNGAPENYHRGEFVTRDGSLWLCTKNCVGVKPGTPDGSSSWRMVVKQGNGGAE